MAPHNREHLKKLLEFLKNEIIYEPDNKWFVNELCKSLPPQKDTSSDDSLLQKVEQYLGLDFKLDSSLPIVDYSFIKDDYLRDCFESDCREMLRYRFGTRGHKINFPEFCRYAMLQIERLLNVYYNSRGSSMSERVDYIRKWNSKYNPKDQNDNLLLPISIEAINFSFKRWAFKNEFNPEKIFNTIDKIAKVRNTQSHGSSTPDADEIFFRSHHESLVKGNYPLLPNGLVDWKKLNKDAVLNNVYNNVIKNSPEHSRYIELVWERQQPFEEVYNCLVYVNQLVRTALQSV